MKAVTKGAFVTTFNLLPWSPSPLLSHHVPPTLPLPATSSILPRNHTLSYLLHSHPKPFSSPTPHKPQPPPPPSKNASPPHPPLPPPHPHHLTPQPRPSPTNPHPKNAALPRLRTQIPRPHAPHPLLRKSLPLSLPHLSNP
jgi:hypothetical protein